MTARKWQLTILGEMAVALARRRHTVNGSGNELLHTVFPDGWADLCFYGPLALLITEPLWAEWGRSHIYLLMPLPLVVSGLFVRHLLSFARK